MGCSSWAGEEVKAVSSGQEGWDVQEWVHPKHRAGGAPGRVCRGIFVQLLSPPCTQKGSEATWASWSIYRAKQGHSTGTGKLPVSLWSSL